MEDASTHSPDHMWYRHPERGKAGEPDQNWFTCECQKLWTMSATFLAGANPAELLLLMLALDLQKRIAG